MYLIALRTFMSLAIEQAKNALSFHGEVPVGSIIVLNGVVVSESGNCVILDNNPTLHSEIVAIRYALLSIGVDKLKNSSIYVTLEPCPMCAYAIALSGIRNVYFGAYNKLYNNLGGMSSVTQYASKRPYIYGGIMQKECSNLINDFFLDTRSKIL